MDNTRPSNISSLRTSLRTCIWLLCISAWTVGTVERSVAVLSQKQLTTLDITQILVAAFFLVSWAVLKPGSSSVNYEEIERS